MKDKIDLIFSNLKNECITEKMAHQQILSLLGLDSDIKSSINQNKTINIGILLPNVCYLNVIENLIHCVELKNEALSQKNKNSATENEKKLIAIIKNLSDKLIEINKIILENAIS